MSSAFSSRRLTPQHGQDILFCHSCGHEWYRSSDDTSPPPACQRCRQEIVEIVTPENDPRTFQQTTNSLFSDTLFNLGGLGSAGPSPRMPSFLPRQQRDQPGHFDDDEDSFGNSFQNQLHRSFHQNIHNEARERATRAHRSTTHGGHDENDGHDHDHNNNFDSDPEEADIDEHEFHAPNNLYMHRTVVSNFTSSNRRPPQTNQPQPGSGASQRPGATEPSDTDSLFRTFTHILHGFHDSQAGRSGTETLFNRSSNSTFREHGASRQRAAPSTSFGATSFTIATGPIRPGQAGETADFNTVLSNILGHVGPPDIEEQNPQAAGALPPGFPAALQNIILAVLSNRDASVQNGDAVHSDEALDRIITMMMETGQQSSGAPPASQNALDELERKKVDQSMLGSEGHAECTICISEVELNEEVLQLPCKHWFHEDCVVMWLKQHNTCPVCRHPVVHNEGGNADRASQSAGASGTAAGGSSNTGNNATPVAGGAQTNNSNSNSSGSGNSLFGNVLTNLALPRGLFININGPGNLPGAAAAWGPGTPDTAGSNTNASGSTAANSSTGSSSSAAPTPFVSSLRQRTAQRPQDLTNQQERLNAIRSAAGLAPSAPSHINTSANANADGNTNASAYRSPRVSESWSERERRRRDSHSPNPGHNMSSRRYNSFAAEFDDWQTPEHPLPSQSSNWNTAPQSNNYRSSFWGTVNGSNSNYSGAGYGRGSGLDSGPGPDTSRNAEQSSWSRRRSSLSRWDSVFGSGSGSGSGHGNGDGNGDDSVNGSMDAPSFGRTNSNQHRLFRFSDDAAPTATNSGRGYAARMPPLASSFSTEVGGDGHGDVYMHDEARGSEAGSVHGRRSSNSSSSNNMNGGGNGSGGSGGLFGFFRRR